MKNKFKCIVIVIIAIMFINTSCRAQFTNFSGSDWNVSGGPSVNHISISTSTSTPSAFFIDGANLSSVNTGNVFSTNGPSATTTNWKMSQNGTESFRIENASSSANVILGTTGAGRLDMQPTTRQVAQHLLGLQVFQQTSN